MTEPTPDRQPTTTYQGTDAAGNPVRIDVFADEPRYRVDATAAQVAYVRMHGMMRE